VEVAGMMMYLLIFDYYSHRVLRNHLLMCIFSTKLMLSSWVAEKISKGIGGVSSAIKGASTVVNLAAILQKPKTEDAYSVGKREAVKR
jgi:hypothetical protein